MDLPERRETNVRKAGTELADEANVVRLRGRLAAEPETRVLPSGDEITTWRLIVPRSPKDVRTRADGRRGVSVDTFDCSAWRSTQRRQARSWNTGDVVEVDGALQRRFYRHAGQLVSRHDVVAHQVRRVARAADQEDET